MIASVPAEHDRELARVDDLAQQLLRHIETTAELIRKLHVFGAQSKSIQEHMGHLLQDQLQFDTEVVLTPQSGFTTRARPDFFLRLGEGRGVIAEVERGGTTTNNHDLKDLWKAHLAPDVQHLFLIVPMNNWRSDGTARERPFTLVARRVGAFFGEPRREVDLLSAHVFGF